MTNKIIEIVIAVTGVTKEDTMKQTRFREIADARKMAMLLCRDYTYNTFWELGTCFDRDHTSVVHACKIARQLIIVDPAFKKLFLQAKNEVEKLGLTKIMIERKKGSRVPLSIKQAA